MSRSAQSHSWLCPFNRSIVLRRLHSLLEFFFFFCENYLEPWTFVGSYMSENNCSGQWRRESRYLTYEMTSSGSTLFAEPVFLFGWPLRNTAWTHCMLTVWLGCTNHALRGEFTSLHRLLQDIFVYALLWLPRFNLSLINCFLIILFRLSETNLSGNKVLMWWIFLYPSLFSWRR